MTTFTKELDFEKALAQHLTQHGWNEIIVNPTEEDLVKNWAGIIYDNNRGLDELGNYPLTDSEMQQVMAQVDVLGGPYDVNKFINGKTVCVVRDNAADVHNYGKEVYLKIFDPKEICAGQSRYQIARQPKFKTASGMMGDRRGDMLLLINGMPVIHIELKRSGVDVSQATYQLKRYMHEGVFSQGIYKMVQVFVAMTPEETLYFANPGSEDRFQPSFYFHWEDYNNTVVTDWQKVATDLLSIPMAHQLIGYYTIADDKDKTLKVLRSYQFWAVAKISDKVQKTNWDDPLHHGGYIWHTTGSGKTMTSFKAADLIANSGDADKVVFLLDRIELSVQSLDEYRGFADDPDDVQDTSDTSVLVTKLKSTAASDKLIVTSLQKMYNLTKSTKVSKATIEEIGKKRVVFVVDECHRSVFGQMLVEIRRTFPRALLFGFTGTPVFEENAKNEIMTSTIFGDELHKYTIANAIPDGNVLGFDLYQVNTFEEKELREVAALNALGIKDEEEIGDNEEMQKEYDWFQTEAPMISTYMENGERKHGVEYYLPKDTYQQAVHHLEVAKDIVGGFASISKNGKFHGILATKNIPEAIAYYELFKQNYPSLNVVAIFDESIDNSDGGIVKEDAILTMLNDYKEKYGVAFQLPQYGKYKKDVAKRLAHKKPYIGIENEHDKQIDLLIVVTQMLTGYDSKWVNALYVDKTMKYVDVIQSFSRTNRLFGPDKPFGIIKYYTFPYTMEQYIQDALEVYVDRSLTVFVDKLEANLHHINALYNHIKGIFESHDIKNFEKLPSTMADRNMFAQDFRKMTHLIEAAKLQTFSWEELDYEFKHDNGRTSVHVEIDEPTYMVLLQRYRELFDREGPGGEENDYVYPIDTFIVEKGTGTIDAEYINSKFQKFVRNLYTEGPEGELTKKALEELHKTFAQMTQKDQRTALLIIHDIQSGELRLTLGKTIQDYILEYQADELRQQIQALVEAIDIDEKMLENIILSDVNEQNIDEFGRFQNLKDTVNASKAKIFVEKVEGRVIPLPRVRMRLDAILRQFILKPTYREQLIQAYYDDDVTIDMLTSLPAMPKEPEEAKPTEGDGIKKAMASYDYGKIKSSVKTVLQSTLVNVLPDMRPIDDVVDSVFKVMDVKTGKDYDSVGMLIVDAMSDLFVDESHNIVKKFNAFNTLTISLEAYLKKMYFIMFGKEVPGKEGEKASLANVWYALKDMWGLKFSSNMAYKQLYHYYTMVKGWRDSIAHNSLAIPVTSTEQEVNAAVNVVLTLYFYATGHYITELEGNELY